MYICSLLPPRDHSILGRIFLGVASIPLYIIRDVRSLVANEVNAVADREHGTPKDRLFHADSDAGNVAASSHSHLVAAATAAVDQAKFAFFHGWPDAHDIE